MKSRGSPRSVIIADNNEFYRQVLGDFYREIGFEVRVAIDGIETLEMVEARRPDLLVLDLIMPRFDGARLSAFFKGHELYREIPIIILSGILAEEIDDVKEIGADAYIAKMPMEQIRARLKEVSESLVEGRESTGPILSGFEKMYRREVVLELLLDRKASRVTLDSLSEGIVELSRDGRILICNRAFLQLAEKPSSAMLARQLDEVFPESHPVIRHMFEELERGEVHVAATIRSGDRHLQLKLHRLAPEVQEPAEEPAGQPTNRMNAVGYTALVEDITQRVKAEREREVLRGRLAQSEKMYALGMFVAGAAHELNNPLTSVLGYAQLLLQKQDTPGTRRELEKIAAGATRCKAILDNLMTFARSNRPAKIPMDFNALLLESLSTSRDRLTEAGIDLVLDLAPELPETLADPLQIVQAFNAIIDNALKAMADLSTARALTIASSASQGKITIEFSDTGRGIPRDVIGKVFEPFFTTRQVGQGAGLGLSVAYGMVTAHAGRINVRNRPEGGASVTLEFPITTREHDDTPSRRARSAAAAAPPKEKRILIVDDETVVQELLVDILESGDHRIDTASNGLEGLRKIEQREYDLIILDLRMPDMTGQQVYDELARDRPDLLGRLLFITADTVTPDVQEFLERVGNPCLMKPFAVDSVMERVAAILDGSP